MFRVQQLKLHAGIGTHIDAPPYLYPQAADVADLCMDDLIAPLAIIDVSDKAHDNYELLQEDIQAFENQYGTIASGTFVMVYTGWSRHFF